CTLYYLLANRLPFPGGSVTDKLLHHRTKEPVPLESLCANLPAGLGAIVRQMMAKEPSARYSTPGAAATALAPYAGGEGATAGFLPCPETIRGGDAFQRAGPTRSTRAPETLLPVPEQTQSPGR